MNVKSMSTPEIESTLDKVSESIAKIKTQIGFAKSEAATTGNYADREWFHSANHALRMAGREHQLLQQELGRRRREERRARNDSVERCFMQIAKRRLDPELFAEMVAEAEDEASRLCNEMAA